MENQKPSSRHSFKMIRSEENNLGTGNSHLLRPMFYCINMKRQNLMEWRRRTKLEGSFGAICMESYQLLFLFNTSCTEYLLRHNDNT